MSITRIWDQSGNARHFEGETEDPFLASVVLLIGPTGVDTSTTIFDESPAAHGNATINGDAQIDTGTVKFVASLQLDGTGDWISYADSNDWDLSNSNTDQFTVEAWVRPAALTGTHVIVGQRPAAGTPVSWVFQISALGSVGFAASSDTLTFNINFGSANGSVAINNWYHLAVDKDSSNKFRLYIDGVMAASQTPANGAISNVTDTLGIGARSGAGGDPFNGRIEELRITKGAARYASDGGFTPPTVRFPRA